MNINCPNCDVEISVVPTAYGLRATCERCLVRWTQLHAEKPQQVWTDELYRPMDDVNRPTRDHAGVSMWD